MLASANTHTHLRYEGESGNRERKRERKTIIFILLWIIYSYTGWNDSRTKGKPLLLRRKTKMKEYFCREWD